VAEADLPTLRIENSILTDQLESALARLDDAEAGSVPAGAPSLAPAEVATLVDRLLAGLDAQLPDLTLRDAELHLKLGVRKLGGEAGFVIPGLDSPPELRETLHEISVRFRCES
jgi:hypothetical protein